MERLLNINKQCGSEEKHANQRLVEK